MTDSNDNDQSKYQGLFKQMCEAISGELGYPEQDYIKAGRAWKKAAEHSPYSEERLAKLFEANYVDEHSLDATKPNDKKDKKGKALIIDDGVDTLKIASLMLKKEGFEPITAEDGIDALEKTLSHQDLSLMLIDLQMPNMNGFEFIETLKSQKAFLDVPIIIITAFTNPQLLKKGQSLGISGWLTKPLQYKSLQETLQKIEFETEIPPLEESKGVA